MCRQSLQEWSLRVSSQLSQKRRHTHTFLDIFPDGRRYAISYWGLSFPTVQEYKRKRKIKRLAVLFGTKRTGQNYLRRCFYESFLKRRARSFFYFRQRRCPNSARLVKIEIYFFFLFQVTSPAQLKATVKF